MQLYLHPDISSFFSGKNIFQQIMALDGQVYRELEGRRTQRIKLGNNYYFIKQHQGVGWKEIFKNLTQLRLPVISAIKRLHELNIPTLDVVGFGKEGCNPAHMKSFLITRELPPHITLEDLGQTWNSTPPLPAFKKNLIDLVAHTARLLHQSGINHRDFYLCHFLLDLIKYSDGTTLLYLIDLHRAQIRKVTPSRWVIKDLAGLYFSSLGMGLTQRDQWRFIRKYSKKSLKEALTQTDFWQKVKNRGDKLYEAHKNISL